MAADADLARRTRSFSSPRGVDDTVDSVLASGVDTVLSAKAGPAPLRTRDLPKTGDLAWKRVAFLPPSTRRRRYYTFGVFYLLISTLRVGKAQGMRADLTNAEIAELLALEAESSRPPAQRALRRASCRAFLWDVKAVALSARVVR